MIIRTVDKLGRLHFRDTATGRYTTTPVRYVAPVAVPPVPEPEPVPLFCWRFTYGLMFVEHHRYYAWIGQVWVKEKDEAKADEVRAAIEDKCPYDDAAAIETRPREQTVGAWSWQQVPYEDGEAEGFGRVTCREEYRSRSNWRRR